MHLPVSDRRKTLIPRLGLATAVLLMATACSQSTPILFGEVEQENSPCLDGLTCITVRAEVESDEGFAGQGEGSCEILAFFGEERAYTAAASGPLVLTPGEMIDWTVALDSAPQPEFTDYSAVCEPLVED